MPLVYGEFDRRPPFPVLGAAAGLCVLLIAGAFWVGRRAPGSAAGASRPRRPRRGLGLAAFTCTAAHYVAVYSLPSSGLPWPWGVGIAAAPLVIGVLVVPRLATTGPYGRDGLRVVIGIVWFLVLIDVFVGLAGRYDLALGALVTAYALHRMLRGGRAPEVTAPATGR